MIIFIWAMDRNNLIGDNDNLPWHIKDELTHFKKETINKTILMGRKTFFSLKKPLPERETLVLTTDKNLLISNTNVKIVNNYQDIVLKYYNNSKNDIYICGGAQIYQLFMPYAEKLIISIIKSEFKGNIYFPKIDLSLYNLIKDKKNAQFNILYYQRREN